MQDVYLGGIVATTSLVGKMGEVTFADGVRLVGQLLGSLVTHDLGRQRCTPW